LQNQSDVTGRIRVLESDVALLQSTISIVAGTINAETPMPTLNTFNIPCYCVVPDALVNTGDITFINTGEYNNYRYADWLYRAPERYLRAIEKTGGIGGNGVLMGGFVNCVACYTGSYVYYNQFRSLLDQMSPEFPPVVNPENRYFEACPGGTDVAVTGLNGLAAVVKAPMSSIGRLRFCPKLDLSPYFDVPFNVFAIAGV